MIRYSIRQLVKRVEDSGKNNRLARTVLELQQKDLVKPRGNRVLTPENLAELTVFEFNKEAPIARMFTMQYSITTEAEERVMSILIPPFIPKEVIAAPKGSTHFQLVAAGAVISLETGNEDQESDIQTSNTWRLDMEDSIGIELRVKLPGTVEGPMMLFFGIRFFDNYNGLLSGKGYEMANGLKLVQVVSS